MQTFWQWLETTSNNIRIDITAYAANIKEQIDEIKVNYQNRAEQAKYFNINSPAVQNALNPYPRKQQLLQSIGKPQFDDEYHQFWVWQRDQLKDWSLERSTMLSATRKAFELVNDYHDSISGQGFNPAEMDACYDEIIKKTISNMEIIKGLIEQAINNDHWNNSPVTIHAEGHYTTLNTSRIATEPAESASITVGQNASFSLFVTNGKIDEIDDIIEGGYEDDEFFDTDKVKSDYYTLINELRNPGSSQKGKILTLFTARPVEDREFYQNNQTLPVNVFLTNSASEADGLSRDLAGGDEPRDVWRVRIDSKYLTQIMFSPSKHFMVSREAPVKMSLY